MPSLAAHAAVMYRLLVEMSLCILSEVLQIVRLVTDTSNVSMPCTCTAPGAAWCRVSMTQTAIHNATYE